MNRFFIITIFSTLVGACSQQDNMSIEDKVRDDNIAKAKASVLSQLKDPSSAQFQNVREVKLGQICGEVNAKNAMGGYVGFQRFYFSSAFGNSMLLDSSSTLCP